MGAYCSFKAPLSDIEGQLGQRCDLVGVNVGDQRRRGCCVQDEGQHVDKEAEAAAPGRPTDWM